MRKMNIIEAIGEAMKEEMRRNQNVILMGEDVSQNIWGTTDGMLEEFGSERILDTPISEAGFCGTGVGAAMTGLRPIIDFAAGSFTYVAMDQIVSMAAKTTYTYGGQYKVPIVMRAGLGYNVGHAAQHSDRPHSMFMNVPGLKIVMPSCAFDMYGLMKCAIRDDDPVFVFEDRSLPAEKENLPDEEFVIPLGKAEIKREGSDITIVAIGGCVPKALTAAAELDAEGISAEVVDPRSLVPLDKEAILNSVRKTGRLIVADPAHKTCSAGSYIAALVAEEGFESLKAAIKVIATDDVPIPFSNALEGQLYPTAEKMITAARMLMR